MSGCNGYIEIFEHGFRISAETVRAEDLRKTPWVQLSAKHDKSDKAQSIEFSFHEKAPNGEYVYPLLFMLDGSAEILTEVS